MTARDHAQFGDAQADEQAAAALIAIGGHMALMVKRKKASAGAISGMPRTARIKEQGRRRVETKKASTG